MLNYSNLKYISVYPTVVPAVMEREVGTHCTGWKSVEGLTQKVLKHPCCVSSVTGKKMDGRVFILFWGKLERKASALKCDIFKVFIQYFLHVDCTQSTLVGTLVSSVITACVTVKKYVSVS